MALASVSKITVPLAILAACAFPACSRTVGTSAPGIENFERVDSHVFRGAQPSDQGFAYLASLGVKTVIDLRESDGLAQSEKAAVEADGMQFVNVAMTGMTPPTDAEINRILGLLEDQTTGPVFVHCKRGADRTGAVIAAYHIDHDRWDNSRALKDAKAHDMSVFQFQRQTFIKAFHPHSTTTAVAPAPASQNN
jgi:protein-tyrosine phosphatase